MNATATIDIRTLVPGGTGRTYELRRGQQGTFVRVELVSEEELKVVVSDKSISVPETFELRFTGFRRVPVFG